MTKDTKLSELVINKLTTAQYNGIATKDPNQLYIVTDAPGFEESITNCLTYIPQDIKLELNNGTLTLAQGCKGYMGDGTVRTTTGTPTLKNTGGSQMFLHITSGGTGLYAGYMTGGTVSERPSSPITYASYYNTTTKKCEYYNGSTWTEVSLPIAIVTRGTDGYISIDQIFNGFGYIGGTVFALPNVKGLIPNGRNEDGTLKNIEFTIDKVLMAPSFNNNVKNYALLNYTKETSVLSLVRSYTNGTSYDNITNLIYRSDGLFPNSVMVVALNSSNEAITSFQPRTVFHAVDYNNAVLKNSDQDIGGNKNFTGVLTVGGQGVLTNYAKKLNSSVTLGVGTTWNDAPSLSLYGPNTTSGIINGFQLRAGANAYVLTGKADGALTWGNKNILTDNNISSIVDWGNPAYGSAVSVSNSGSYTAPSSGWLFLTITGSSGGETSANIGSVQVAYGWYTNTGVGARVNIPMSKGDTITWNTGRITGTIQFVKRKGG